MIINNSVGGRPCAGMAWLSHYAASKSGLVGLSRSWAIELAPYNIRVVALCPTGVNTPMNDGLAMLEGKTLAREIVRDAPPATLLSMPWIEPEDVAAAVVFLASPARRRAITGSEFLVDAGLLAQANVIWNRVRGGRCCCWRIAVTGEIGVSDEFRPIPGSAPSLGPVAIVSGYRAVAEDGATEVLVRDLSRRPAGRRSLGDARPSDAHGGPDRAPRGDSRARARSGQRSALSGHRMGWRDNAGRLGAGNRAQEAP